MTESDIPSAYVRDKRTPPPSREELRARIPGWGADLDPADRPAVPRERFDPAASGGRIRGLGLHIGHVVVSSPASLG